MPNLKELREKRADLKSQADALNDKSTITKEEGTAFDGLLSEIEAVDAQIERALKVDEINRRTVSQSVTDGATTATTSNPITVNVIPERKPDTEGQLRKDFRLIEAMKMVADGRALTGRPAEAAQEADKEARELGVSLSGNIRIPGWLARAEKRDMTVGTTTAGGHTVATDLGGLVPLLEPRMVLRDMGADYLTGLVGNLDLPRHTTAQSASWAAEQGSLSETDPVFDKISLTPNRLGAITDYSKTLLVQSSIGVENMVRSELNRVVGNAVDIAGLHGRDTSNQPGGIVKAAANGTDVGTITSGVGTVLAGNGTDGGLPTWATLVSLESVISAANGDYGTMAYLTHPSMVGKLKTIEKASNTGMFLWGPPSNAGATGQNMGIGEMNGYRAFRSTLSPGALTKGATTAGCYYIYFGNWSELMIAQWGGLDIVIDPYTQAATGNVRMVVQSWWDAAMKHTASFAVCTDAKIA